MCASNGDNKNYIIKQMCNIEKILMILEKNDDEFTPPLI